MAVIPDQPRTANVRPTASRAIAALILREMSTTHGRSPGGYLWSVIEPLAAITLMSYVFSLILRSPSLGENFSLFYATGYLTYFLFHDMTNKVATAIRFSRPLLTFSVVRISDTIFARATLNALTQLLVIVIVLGTLLFLDGAQYRVDLASVMKGLSMAAALGLGIGSVNCFLFESFPAWERIWGVLTRPLFIVSGVFFIFEDIPTQFARILWFNPLFHATGEVRRGIYPMYDPDYISEVYAYGVALFAMATGLLLLSRFSEKLLHK